MRTYDVMQRRSLARVALCSFLAVFSASRMLVLLIMMRTIPDLFVHVCGTHLHHLNYGIFLLSGLAGYLLLCQPSGRRLRNAAVIYGAAMALTYDEFGMWLHLGGSYWQRASWDAVGVIAAFFALLAFAPSPTRSSSCSRASDVSMTAAVTCVVAILWWSLPQRVQRLDQNLSLIESQAPP